MMPDQTQKAEADLGVARLAIDRGWLTEAQVATAIAAKNKTPSSTLLEHLPLTPDQITRLRTETATATARAGEGVEAAATERPVPDEVKEASKIASNRAGRYCLVSHLGSGGMGMVFRAWDFELHRWVALKYLRQSGDEVARQYFRREALLAAALDHPNVAKIYEVGEREGTPFIAMQFIDGDSLDKAARRMSLDEKAGVTRKVAEAIRAAHALKLIHRDIKPANVMIDRQGQVYVMDFGLAKETTVDGQSLGGTSVIVGTPSYMAPEQARGKAGEASDLYGVGAMLYDLVTGRPPFVGENSTDVVLQVVESEPIWPRKLNPQTPPDLEAVILKCLEKEPRRRYADANQIVEDLERYAQREPLRYARTPSISYFMAKKFRKQPLLWISVAAFLIALVGGAIFGTTQLLRAKKAAEETVEVEREGRRRTEEQRRKAEENAQEARAAEREARMQEWKARLEAASTWYEKSFRMSDEKRLHAAAACCLRALEMAPRNLRPEGYPSSPEDPAWAEGAWIRYLHLLPQLDREEMRLEAGQGGRPLAVSADGKSVFTESADHAVVIWDAESSKPIGRLEGHTGRLVGFALSRDGRLAFTAGIDLTLRVWDVAKRAQTGLFRVGPEAAPRCLAMTPDGTRAVSGHEDSTVRIWDLTTKKESHSASIAGVRTSVPCVAITAKGDRVAAYDGLAGLFILKSDTGEQAAWLDAGAVSYVAFLGDAVGLITGTASGTIDVWDLSAKKVTRRFSGHGHDVTGVAVRSDAKEIYSCSHDGTVRVWDVATMQELRRLEVSTSRLVRLGLRAGGSIVWAACDDGTMRSWRLAPRGADLQLEGHTQRVTSLALSEDGLTMLSGSSDAAVRVWNLKTAKCVRVLTGHKRGVRQVALSRDGRIGLSSSEDQSVIVWEVSEGKELRKIVESGPPFAPDVALSPDGSQAWVDSAAGLEARFIDVDSGREAPPRVVSGDAADGAAVFWNSLARGEIGRVRSRVSSALAVTVSSDGTTTLVVGMNDVCVSDVKEDRLRSRFSFSEPLSGGAIGRDGRTAALFEWARGGLRLWDVGRWVELRRFEGEVSCVTFHPDGRRVAVGQEDGKILFWRILDEGVSSEPPGVHPGESDPYREFEPRYRPVGLRVVREGPRKGAVAPLF